MNETNVTGAQNEVSDGEPKVWHTVTVGDKDYQVFEESPSKAIEAVKSLSDLIVDGKMVITNEDDFERLKPITNHIDDNASLDGCMFETYGAELEFVRSMPSENVWTYVEGDDTLMYVSGHHHVNRLGYIVTALPFIGDDSGFVVHDFSEDDEDDEDYED